MSDAPRKPLEPISPELRKKFLDEHSLGEDLHPLTSNPVERAAQLKANALPVIPLNKEDRLKALEAALTAGQEKKMDTLISPKLAKAAGVVAAVLGVIALTLPMLPFSLPAWVGVVVWALTYVAALLAGLPLPGFKGGGPIVPMALVPTLLSIASGCAALASTMHPGTLQSLVLLTGALCTALAGKAIPPPAAVEAAKG